MKRKLLYFTAALQYENLKLNWRRETARRRYYWEMLRAKATERYQMCVSLPLSCLDL